MVGGGGGGGRRRRRRGVPVTRRHAPSRRHIARMLPAALPCAAATRHRARHILPLASLSPEELPAPPRNAAAPTHCGGRGD